MRILLDECLPRDLKKEIIDGNEVRTVPEMGWASKKNGNLLGLANGKFDVLLTADRHIFEQQNLSRFDIAIIVVPTNRKSLMPKLAPALKQSLARVRPGQYVMMDIGPNAERWTKMKLQSISLGKKTTHVFRSDENGRTH